MSNIKNGLVLNVFKIKPFYFLENVILANFKEWNRNRAH